MQAFEIVTAALPAARASSLVPAVPKLCPALACGLAINQSWATRLEALRCTSALCASLSHAEAPTSVAAPVASDVLPASLASADDKLSQVCSVAGPGALCTGSLDNDVIGPAVLLTPFVVAGQVSVAGCG